MAKEINKFVISAIAIVILTAIVLVGISVSTTFSKVLRLETPTNASTSVAVATLAAPNTSNEVGSSGTWPFLQSLTLCGNGTDRNSTHNLLSESFYSISEGTTTGGTITLNQDGLDWAGESINCSGLTYLADTDAQAVADKFSTGLATFGTFTVILVLAIVGKAIIGLFKKKD